MVRLLRVPDNQQSAEDLAREISRELPSPYCPGRSLASCPTEAARELEREIVQQASSGKSRTAIESALVSRFGIEKMGSTVRTDIMWGVGLATVLAVVAVVLAGRKWSRGAKATVVANSGDALAPTGATSPSNVAVSELNRLDDELDDLETLS